VFGTNIAIPQPVGFFLAIHDDIGHSLCKLIVHKFIVLLKYSVYFPVCKDTHNNNAYHCFLIYISITKCMPSFDRLNGLNKNKGYSKLFTK
jgi:hypothetical protein